MARTTTERSNPLNPWTVPKNTSGGILAGVEFHDGVDVLCDICQIVAINDSFPVYPWYRNFADVAMRKPEHPFRLYVSIRPAGA